MANKKITDVDVVSTVSDADYLFVNQGQSIKQIKKLDIPKPIYTAEEVGALPNTTTTLPNPNALTFTGAVTGSYDGSSPVEINIPECGGTDVAVDTTLRVAGQAADAKATGDDISSLSDEIPSKTSDLQNDSGFLTEHQDLSNYALKSEIPKTAADVGAEASGTAESKVSVHNTATDSHNDIRELISGLTQRLNALADSDDTTLDQMSEVVAYIKSNKSLIDTITTSKVSVSDIIDNLTTNVSNKPLSAAQGVVLKALIDAIAVPTKLSELENDSGYAKTTDIPDKLPNPQKLIFSGAVTAEYDGSGAVTVTIPEGSGISGASDEKWEYIGEFTETNQPTFESGKYRFFYVETFFTADATSVNSYRFLCIDGYNYCRWLFANTTNLKMRMFIAHGLCSLQNFTSGTTYPTLTDRGNVSLHGSGVESKSVGTAFWTTTDSTNYPVATFGIKLWGAK